MLNLIEDLLKGEKVKFNGRSNPVPLKFSVSSYFSHGFKSDVYIILLR